MSDAHPTCWQPDAERMDRGELEQLQLERLEATLHRVHRNVPFYRRRFEETGFDPDDLRSAQDLRRLPFTTREDLLQNYPYGMFAVPLRDIVRVHASSGASASSAVVGYTRNDVRTKSNLVARVLVAGGATKEDVIQIAFPHGLLAGAFGLHDGAERLGASVIPAWSGDLRRQLRILQDFRTTTLVSTPSYALLIANAMIDAGLNRSALSLRHGLFGAEPWSEETRAELQEKLGITATDGYGLNEVLGPGVAGECLQRDGLHVQEDHFLLELVDPTTLEPVAPGQPGELVLTTLTREAFPLIRFRTRDVTALLPSPCACGRTTARVRRLMGRTDDRFVLDGVSLYPSQIEAVLREVEGAEPHFQIVLDRKGGLDQGTVLVEVAESIFFDEMRRQSQIKDALQHRLEAELGVPIAIKLVEKRTLERPGGQPARLVDRRRI